MPKKMIGEKNRKWLRLHLTTAIIALLVIGLFMGVNLVPSNGPYYSFKAGEPEKSVFGSRNPIVSLTSLGWPKAYKQWWNNEHMDESRPPQLETRNLICDIAVTALSVLLTIICCELWISYRKTVYRIKRGTVLLSVMVLPISMAYLSMTWSDFSCTAFNCMIEMAVGVALLLSPIPCETILRRRERRKP